MRRCLLQLSACCYIGLVAVVVSSSGCGASSASGPMDDGMDSQAAAVEAAGGQMDVHLNFAHSDVTDEDIASLALPVATTSIDLSYTKISNDALKSLQRLPNLEQIHIASTAITDEGLEHLMQMEKLWLINANHSKISRQGQLKLIKFLAPRAQARAVERSPNKSQ